MRQDSHVREFYPQHWIVGLIGWVARDEFHSCHSVKICISGAADMPWFLRPIDVEVIPALRQKMHHERNTLHDNLHPPPLLRPLSSYLCTGFLSGTLNKWQNLCDQMKLKDLELSNGSTSLWIFIDGWSCSFSAQEFYIFFAILIGISSVQRRSKWKIQGN